MYVCKRAAAFACGYAMDQRHGIRDWQPSRADIGEVNRMADALWPACVRTAMTERLWVVARDLVATGEKAVERLVWEGLLRAPFVIDGQRAAEIVGRDVESLRWLVSGEIEAVARLVVVRSQPVDSPSHPSARGVG